MLFAASRRIGRQARTFAEEIMPAFGQAPMALAQL
jgi:hypothetical protein